MSHKAWVFISVVLASGVACLAWSLFAFDPGSAQSQLLTFLLLTALGTVSQLFETSHGKQSYYPHFVFFVASIFLLQPPLWVLVILLPHLVEWAKERLTGSDHLRNWYLQPFNIATHLVSAWGAWGTHQAISTRMAGMVDPLFSLQVVPVMSAICSVLMYVVLNHALVGMALVLARKISWRQSGVMKWQSLQPDFIMSCLGYVVAVLWQSNPWLVLPALSPLVLMYQALMIPQLKHEAQTDGKTGLHNARHFSTLYQAEIERTKRFGRPLALIMADLDLLRNINNTYGHLAGDAVLAGIGKIIRETVRDFDIAGRFGGEEFAIALPEVTPEEARATAERLRAAVEGAWFSVPNNSTQLHVTMSVGVACYPIDADNATDLIHRADIAVYQAKLNGRNCVVCGSDIPSSIDFAPPPSERLSAPYSANFTPRPTQANGAYNGAANGLQSSMPAAALATKSAPAAENSPAAPTPIGRPPLRPNTAPILAAGTAPLISPMTVALGAARAATAAVTTQPITRPITEPKLKAEKYQIHVSDQAQPAPGRLQKAVFPMFITSVILAGFAFAFTGFFMHATPDPIAVALFVMLAVGAELMQLDLYGKGTVSVSVAVAFAAALVTGLPGLVLVSAAIVLAHRVRQQPFLDKTSAYKTAFNWATHVLAGVLPVFALRFLQLEFRLDNLPVLIVPMVIVAVAYFIVDTGLIATVISLVSGDSPVKVWHERYQWLVSHYLTLCTLGTFVGLAYTTTGPLGVIVFTLPVLMMRVAMKQYISQTEHSVRELQRMNVELTHANAEVVSASRTMQSLNEELFLTLSKIIDARDPYVGGHASKVGDYAVAIAHDLGVEPERFEPLRQAGFLHDIGKIAISEAVLHKPSKLTDEEYEYIKTHAALGGEFLATCRSLRHLAPFVRHHHERWDGKGYPDKLAGEDIPLEARILAVCDAVEAMASDRPYRKGMSLDEVIAEVKRCAGTQFDPYVAAAFVSIAERERDQLIVNSATEVHRKVLATGDPSNHGHVNGGFLNNMQPSGERLITGSLAGGLHKTGPLATGPLTPSNLNTGPLSMATAS
ncbi:MAG: diguanylate cyclase [Chloroflexota bacterium]|nr:diguanylate cyclase [Chloroflexota bacterium]MDQ5864848.1 diguanylate cyclase [Chloroflexota bacterium]